MEVHGWKKSLLDIASDIHAGFNLGTPNSWVSSRISHVSTRFVFIGGS